MDSAADRPPGNTGSRHNMAILASHRSRSTWEARASDKAQLLTSPSQDLCADHQRSIETTPRLHTTPLDRRRTRGSCSQEIHVRYPFRLTKSSTVSDLALQSGGVSGVFFLEVDLKSRHQSWAGHKYVARTCDGGGANICPAEPAPNDCFPS